MAYTTTELADATLREMGVTDASETPEAFERTIVTDKYAAWYDEHRAHGNELVYWASDDIPDPVFGILVDLMALESAASFGMRMSPAEKEQQKTLILRRLRRHVSVQSGKGSVRATYF